ncbi:MAG: glycosyltransferase [Acidobacteria bacterium]|nr:glycosyltransferase [Acidobacteriota bacterium]
MQNYWVAYGLAERGHEVYLVTNANEVEPAYRMYVEDDDKTNFEPKFKETGGFVRLRNSEGFERRRMGHIPCTNPFVTKLASIATETVKQYNCEIIYSYYFEPYAMAGYLASCWTGRPLIVQHAGSDLDRLMKVPDLSTAYREVLKAARFVVTRRNLRSRFMALGVEQEKIRSDMSFGLPTNLFNPNSPPMDVSGFLERAASHIQEKLDWHSRPIDLSKPTIGIYGKVGLFKGSYDLVHALAKLSGEGLDFNFLAMTQGLQSEQFRNIIRSVGLEDRTWLLPFVPHWKVPGFIRACTAVCFLERDFPIAIHGPTVPREVMACGKCLILSGEIVRKQPYLRRQAGGENLLVVEDPKDHEELARVLRSVILNPEAAVRIGNEAHQVSASIERFTDFIGGYERMFSECCAEQDDGSPAMQSQRYASHNNSLTDAINDFLPYTSKLLSDELTEVVSLFNSRGTDGSDKLHYVHSFCDFLSELLNRAQLKPKYTYFADVFNYESAEVSLLAGNNGAQSPVFSGVNKLNGHGFRASVIAGLRPLKTNYCVVETFDHDIQNLLDMLSGAEDLPDTVERKPTSMLFARLPNMKVVKLKINQATKSLLELCDGANTTESIMHSLGRSQGEGEAKGTNKQREVIAAALGQLYDKGVLIFC